MYTFVCLFVCLFFCLTDGVLVGVVLAPVHVCADSCELDHVAVETVQLLFPL